MDNVHITLGAFKDIIKEVWKSVRSKLYFPEDEEMKIEKIFLDELNIFLQIPRE